jgi:hypothetical protein
LLRHGGQQVQQLYSCFLLAEGFFSQIFHFLSANDIAQQEMWHNMSPLLFGHFQKYLRYSASLRHKVSINLASQPKGL